MYYQFFVFFSASPDFPPSSFQAWPAADHGVCAVNHIKYGADWEIKKEKIFVSLSSDTVSLKNFVKVPDGQIFALIQKTDCLSRFAASLTLFCIAF